MNQSLLIRSVTVSLFLNYSRIFNFACREETRMSSHSLQRPEGSQTRRAGSCWSRRWRRCGVRAVSWCHEGPLPSACGCVCAGAYAGRPAGDSNACVGTERRLVQAQCLSERRQSEDGEEDTAASSPLTVGHHQQLEGRVSARGGISVL